MPLDAKQQCSSGAASSAAQPAEPAKMWAAGSRVPTLAELRPGAALLTEACQDPKFANTHAKCMSVSPGQLSFCRMLGEAIGNLADPKVESAWEAFSRLPDQERSLLMANMYKHEVMMEMTPEQHELHKDATFEFLCELVCTQVGIGLLKEVAATFYALDLRSCRAW